MLEWIKRLFSKLKVTIEVYQGKDKLWRWHMKALNNEITTCSSQGYGDKTFCLKMAQAHKKVKVVGFIVLD